MRQLKLVPATTEFTEALLAFELENKTYFQQFIYARKTGFFSLQAVEQHLALAEQEWKSGKSYQLLMVFTDRDTPDEAPQIVGRINLRNLRSIQNTANNKTPATSQHQSESRNVLRSAEVGYRVGEAFAGQGIATKALGLLVNFTQQKLALDYLHASVALNDNIGSQIVLLRNGFNFKARKKNGIIINGKTLDLVHFERFLN